MTDLESAIDESMNHEERAVRAMESMASSFGEIAEALTVIGKLGSQWYEKLYPARTPKDATVTRIKTEEERKREDLGDTGESLDEWQTIGPRELEVITKEKK